MKLIVSEKDIAAKRIAKILSGNGVKEEHVYGVSVYSFSSKGQDYKTIGLKGHILQIEFPDEYANWIKVPPRDLVDADILKKPLEKKIIQALNKTAADADEIIIATDFDREGELIGYDALEVIKEKKGAVNANRAKFSAITQKDIEEAFSKTTKLDENLAFAGMARQDIDLIWGAVLTRKISLISYQYRDKFLSVGRVQTPTLAIIVEKELEIDNFKSEPYWQIKARLLNDKSEEFDAIHHTKRFPDEDSAKKVYDKLGKNAEVTAVKESIRTIKPPAPLNTTSLIVAANALGFSAQKTINTAENLYINGYISYPRTDNTVYPQSIDLKEYVKALLDVDELRSMAEEVLSQDQLRPTRGAKNTTDHPPIYPVAAASKENLSPDEWKLYELVCRRFAATLLPEASSKNTVAQIEIDGERFIANGSKITEGGWTKHYPYYKHPEIFVPALLQGEKLEVLNKEILSKETKPPARFNQGRLVEKMEELGLGTKATRHSIIQTLITRGYLKGNPLEPSKKAIAVIKALKENAAKITSHEMTKELEEDMDAISKGHLERSKVVDISRKALKNILDLIEKNEKQISQGILKGIKDDEVVGNCPDEECEGNLIIRYSPKTKKKFIGCSNYPKCKKAFPMPQNGLILTTEEKCKVCSYPVIKVIRKGKRPWELCINPQCPSKNEDYKNSKNKKSTEETDN